MSRITYLCIVFHIYYFRYQEYGYTKREIGFLFVIGYTSSLVFGPVIGLLSDKYGRKLMCTFYGIIYSIGALLKNYKELKYLVAGRICTGIATSILTTGFESWLVQEFLKVFFYHKL